MADGKRPERQTCPNASDHHPDDVLKSQRINWRLAVAALIIGCVLPIVLVLAVATYVHCELTLINSHLAQVVTDCRCRHPIVDNLHPVAASPVQVNASAVRTLFNVH